MSKYTYRLKVQDPDGDWIESAAVGVAKRLDAKVAIVRRQTTE